MPETEISHLRKKHNSRNESMVSSYKNRVAEFIKKVSKNPQVKQDTYGQGFLDFTNAARRKGPATMNFGANKGDRDRLEKLGRTTNDRIDNAPAQTEHKAWNMRPRRK